MPHLIEGRNASELLTEAFVDVHELAENQTSRNGDVLSLTGPTILHNKNPREKIIFCPIRRINPFFALAECIWMISGSDRVDFLSQFNPRMKEYSDDGETLTGSAYGFRWRNHFQYDQVDVAIRLLMEDRRNRRVVITHWDPYSDLLDQSSKDLPCNLQIIPRIVRGALDLTVTNRSNDLIYGALGANSCHFAFLQEFMAQSIGVPVGSLYQISNNLHIYTDNPVYKRIIGEFHPLGYEIYDPYSGGEVSIFAPLFNDSENFEMECRQAVDTPLEEQILSKDFTEPFFKQVWIPMVQAWLLWKSKDEDCLAPLDENDSTDWIVASRQFLKTSKLFKGE